MLQVRDRPDASRPREGDGRTILTNTGALVAGRYVVAALGWAGTLLIVRNLSVDEWGRFSFVFSLLGLLAVVTELGIGRVALKGLVDPSGDTGHFAGTYVVLRAVLGVVGYLVALLVVVLGGYPGEVVAATAVAGVVVLVATPSHALDNIFQAHLRMRAVAVATVLGQLAQLALVAAIASSRGSVVLFTVPAVVGELVVIAWKLRQVSGLVRLRLRVHWPTWKGLLSEAAPIAVGGVLATFYFRIDTVMLSRLDTFSAVGIYGVAYKFVDLLHYLPVALLAPVLTVLVRSWPHDLAAFRRTFQRALTILVLVGVLVAVEFLLFAGPVIALLYGERYAVGADAARLVVAAECVGGLGLLAFNALLAMGRHRLYPLAALMGLVTNIGLNLWLIPSLSYRGAALATLITEVLVVAVLWVPLARVGALRPLPLARTGGAVLAGAAAAAVGAGAAPLVPWPVAAAAAAGVYVALIHVGRVPGPDGLASLARDPDLDCREPNTAEVRP